MTELSLYIHREEEVSQGFRDIMEAYKEEVTALFYWDNTGIRDQVFTHFYTEYRTDVEQRLATFQAKYGGIIDRQSTILKEVEIHTNNAPFQPWRSL